MHVRDIELEVGREDEVKRVRITGVQFYAAEEVRPWPQVEHDHVITGRLQTKDGQRIAVAGEWVLARIRGTVNELIDGKTRYEIRRFAGASGSVDGHCSIGIHVHPRVGNKWEIHLFGFGVSDQLALLVPPAVRRGD